MNAMWILRRTTVILGFFEILARQAVAVPLCPPRLDVLRDLENVNQPLLVNQIDEADRRTAKQYAAEHGTTEDEIKRRYAATGDLECGRSMSQANVTVLGDIITTSAHSVNPSGCIDRNKPVSCTLHLVVDGETLSYKANQLIDSGQECGKPKTASAHDWAILKLDKAVDPRIKPYPIDLKFPMRMFKNTPVTAIGKSFDFPNTKEKDLFKHPKHYGDCEIKSANGMSSMTNCDLSPGSSGGALVTPGPDPILVGVHEAEVLGGPDCPPYNAAKRTGPYSLCWANQSTMIIKDFSEALVKATAKAAPPQ